MPLMPPPMTHTSTFGLWRSPSNISSRFMMAVRYLSMSASFAAMAASMAARSSASSRIVPARALSSACAGLRAPQSAKVMPGCASVQAMTVWAMLAPCFSATGRIASAKRRRLLAVADREARIVLALVVAGKDAVRTDGAGEQAQRQRGIAQRRDAVAPWSAAARSASISRSIMLNRSWMASRPPAAI